MRFLLICLVLSCNYLSAAEFDNADEIDSVSLPDSMVKDVDSAHSLLTNSFYRLVNLNVSSDQMLTVDLPFRCGFALGGFCDRDDMVWPGQVTSILGDVYGVLWLNAENGKVLVLAGQWDQVKDEIPYLIIDQE